MEVIAMIIGAVLWLVVFCAGSIALERTGMDRTKARFQALSAITGTGFTTSEAESVVNHPRRRRIVTWLMLLGNTAVIAFVIGLIVLIIVGTRFPTSVEIGIIISIVATIGLFIKFRGFDKLTDRILKKLHKTRPVSHLVTEELFHRAGRYGVARIQVKDEAIVPDLTLKGFGFAERDIMVLAIEREGTVISLPRAEEPVLAGDYLLCYGTVCEMLKTKQ